MQIGLSCCTEGNSRRGHGGKREKGRRFMRGCPCRPGGLRIRSGLRRNAECTIFVSLPRMLRECVKAWGSSASD
eukprot:4958751-Pyramimonas_sp.AAC.1